MCNRLPTQKCSRSFVQYAQKRDKYNRFHMDKTIENILYRYQQAQTNVKTVNPPDHRLSGTPVMISRLLCFLPLRQP